MGIVSVPGLLKRGEMYYYRTRSFQMARSGPGDAARNPVVRRLRAATRSRFAGDAYPARRCAALTLR